MKKKENKVNENNNNTAIEYFSPKGTNTRENLFERKICFTFVITRKKYRLKKIGLLGEKRFRLTKIISKSLHFYLTLFL